MVKYTTPELEMIDIETADVVLQSPEIGTGTVEHEHNYVNKVCTICGAEKGELPPSEF